MRDVTWFLTNWHWLYTAIAACLLFWVGYIVVGTARIVADLRQEHREAAEFEAELDDAEDAPRERCAYITSYDCRCNDPAYCPIIAAPPGTYPLHTDLPGPDALVAPAGLRAGEVHYMDTWLGRPGDGSEHTALRVRREGEAMLARVEAARRELAAECGIRYVPMELVAA